MLVSKLCDNDCGKEGVKFWRTGLFVCQSCYDKWKNDEDEMIGIKDSNFEIFTGR